MDIELVAFESLGVRSMCTFVRTPDLSVLIDPSAACHARNSLMPHPREYEVLVRKRAEIIEKSRDADAIVTSHYHLDHLSRWETDLVTTFSNRRFTDAVYPGKILMCKDPTVNIQENQGVRGRAFHDEYAGRARAYEVADGRAFRFGSTSVSFSPALWHGKEQTVQGCVVGTSIDDGSTKLVHASDVQLLNPGCVDWMISEEPDLAVVAGPPIFDRSRVGDPERDLSSALLARLARNVPRVVVDHHLLRSSEWRGFVDGVGRGVVCAAEHIGREVTNLEARRPSLYEAEPVGGGFHRELQEGRIPEGLGRVVREAGMESVYGENL